MRALEQIPEFHVLAERPENRELMDLSKAVEGMKRHVSCHASAIVVSNGPLTNYVPLFKDKHDQVASQFEGKIVEEVGIVKFDSLGLRSLSETYDCLQMIKANHDKDIKLEEIPFDDKQTYALLSRGLINGLFQLEASPGMYRVVTQLKPDTFEEFSAIPGTLSSGSAGKRHDATVYRPKKTGCRRWNISMNPLKARSKTPTGLCLSRAGDADRTRYGGLYPR